MRDRGDGISGNKALGGDDSCDIVSLNGVTEEYSDSRSLTR